MREDELLSDGSDDHENDSLLHSQPLFDEG